MVSGTAGPNDRAGIWVLSVVGGMLRKLRDDAYGAVPSPDGSRIGFDYRGEIWLMGTNGEDAHRLVPRKSGTASDESRGLRTVSASPT